MDMDPFGGGYGEDSSGLSPNLLEGDGTGTSVTPPSTSPASSLPMEGPPP